MPVTVKFQKIAEELKRRIAGNAYAGHLPSRRALMQEFQVSSRTLHKVFTELKLSGAVTTSHSGTAITPVTPRHARILIAAPGGADNLDNDPISRRLCEHVRDYGFDLLWCDSTRTSPAEAVREAGLTTGDGVLFTNSAFTPEVGKELLAKKIPFVSGNRPATDFPVSWVDWNHLELFDDLLGKLIGNGIRSIDFFVNNPAIRADFLAVKKSYLLYNRELDAFPMGPESDVASYARHLASLKHLPEVVFIDGLYRSTLLEELRRLDICGDSVLCTYGQIDHPTEVPQGIAYSERAYRQLADKLWRLFFYLRRHPAAPPRAVKQHCEICFGKNSHYITPIFSKERFAS